ncbi:MAG: DUF3857 domain-containing protein [Chitinophagaceae bacterium]|nr:DUF3857 domain-containing protein [Chitinophagaceae bacterium]
MRTITLIQNLVGCLLTVAPILLQAQTAEQLKARYPGDVAVVLKSALHYKIVVKNGQPEIESKETQKILYLSDNAGAYMSRYGFSHSSFHELREYQAYTQTKADKKVKVTDFTTSSKTSGGVFYDDIKETKFDFPSITEGATGNLEISIAHKKPYLLSPYYFSRFIPVVNSELKITFPRTMGIKYVLKGIDTSFIKVSLEEKRDNYIYTFHVKDLPAELSYPDAPDNSWYSPHVVFYIDHYKNEQGETVNYLSNVNDLYKLNSSFIKDLSKEAGPDLRRIVDSLTGSLKLPEEKAKRIYSWVQEHIKYVAFEDGMEGFIPRDANFVCSRRFGDCKDMSSILTLMLNTAGVPAYHTWIGTRDLPYTYSETPLPIVDNHMICAVQLNGHFVFLDGTDADCTFGMPSQGIQDKEALISISPAEYKIVRVPVPSKEANYTTDSTFLELTNEGLKGSISRRLKGYPAMQTHSLVNYTNDRDREKYLKNKLSRGSNKFQLLNFTTGDAFNKNEAHLSASFSLQDYARKADDEWYLNLNLFKFYEHEEIDIPKRTMPIEFGYLFSSRFVTVLKIPEGYKVSYLPKGKSFHNKVWGFDISYEQKGNTIVLTQQFDNDHLILYKDQFEAWNEVLRHLFPLYKESISLSKK